MNERTPETIIEEQLQAIESLAAASLRQDHRERVRHWILLGVAFIGATGAAVAASLVATKAALVLAAASALAIAIDAALPTTQSPRVRAVHELRALQNSLSIRWAKVCLAHPDARAPQRVAHAQAMLDQVHAKRDEVGRYLSEFVPVARLEWQGEPAAPLSAEQELA